MKNTAALILVLCLAGLVRAQSLTATPNTLNAVLDKARSDKTIIEIILTAGVYRGDERAVQKAADDAPALTIRAADGAEVIFDGGGVVTDAVESAGIYAIAGKTADMWEVDTRIRYVQVADAQTVAAAPATYANVGDRIIFRTSDDSPPSAHRIGYAVNNAGFRITRAGTTLAGITFRNYHASTWSSGVFVDAPDVTIRNCTTTNARAGFFVYSKHQNVRIEDCRIEDVGCGIYTMATGSQIHGNTILKRRDRFQVPTYWQDDNGIQCYDPADGGEITGNLVVGYNFGIYCKCRGQWRVEHNTVVESKSGLYRSGWKQGNIYRYNIVSDTQSPFHNYGTMHGPVDVDANLLWAPRELMLFHASVDATARVGNHRNLIADPRFVDPVRGDYRLLPDSPAVTLAVAGKPYGARPVGGLEVDATAPVVRVTLDAPAVRSGAVGVEVFERDAWIGGGRQLVGEHFVPRGDVDFVVPSKRVRLNIDARDAVGAPAQLQIRIAPGDWQPAGAFVTQKELELPQAGVNDLGVRVADNAGNWSEPSVLQVRVAETAPNLEGNVVVHASDRGVILSFRTDQPATATVAYGKAGTFDQTARRPRRVVRDWDVMAGGDNIVEWSEPAMQHHVPILAPGVQAGETYAYRIQIADAVGNRSTAGEGTFMVRGPAREVRVGGGGKDEDGASLYATLQFAVDRALPGDTVVIEPGIYLGETFVGHGGVEGAPITIRGAQRGGVVLDGVRQSRALLRLEAAPHVHVADLEMRWTTLRGSAVYAADSPGLQVRGCKIWNKHFGNAWGEGYAVFTHRCPGALFDHNLIFREEVGLYLLQSPNATITHNTAVQCLLGGVMLSVQSAPGTVMMNNSLTFNGNDQFYIETLDPSEVATFRSDYNNFATQLRMSNEGGDMSVKAPHPHLKQESKAIIAGPLGRYRDMDSWRKAHGQDMHSLFADPKYIDPIQHDFRLMPDSPNIKAGSDGSDIGALPVAEDNP